ncbi:MAG: septal ring lytic transglycosylase RlpA family protein [Pseudomonadota bacterium]|nr:septal ring lytic transglycosylase RlpA family protein [Pseudomonadota bacterium]
MSLRFLPARRSALTLAVTLALAASVQAQSAPAASEPAAATATAAPAASSTATASADSSDGKVAYYGRKFAGRKTASGQRFNPDALTMAHKTLPFGTKVKVTNVKNGKSVVVRVNDRGPTAPDRVGDLSLAAARKIGMLHSGVVDARLEVVSQGQ